MGGKKSSCGVATQEENADILHLQRRSHLLLSGHGIIQCQILSDKFFTDWPPQNFMEVILWVNNLGSLAHSQLK